MRTRVRALTALALALAVTRCGSAEAPRTCNSDGDCPANSFCRQSLCVIDSTAPVLTITSPADRAVITSATFQLTGSVSDGLGSGVDRVEYQFTSDATPIAVPVVDGAFSVELATPELDSKAVALEIRATDRLGQTETSTVAILVDRVGPTLRISSPGRTRAAKPLVGSALSWTGTASDRSGALDRTEFSIDGGQTWLRFDDPARFEVDYAVPADEPGKTLAVQIRSFDRFGNGSALWTSAEVFIDTVPPALEVVTPTENVVHAGPDAGQVLLLSGTIADRNLESLSYTLDWQLPAHALVMTEGAFATTIEIGEEDYTQHTLEVVATDLGGNRVAMQRTFFVDRAAPRLTLEGLDEGALLSLSTAEPVLVRGLASDASLARLAVRLDSKEQLLDASQQAFQLPLPLVAEDRKVHTLSIEASDAYGNSATLTRHYTVDRLAPRLRLTTPEADLAILNAQAPSSLSVTGTLEEADLDVLLFALDASPAVAVALTGTQFTVEVPLADEDSVQHSFTLTARDRLGNETRLTRSFIVDRVAPVLVVNAPPDGSIFNAAAADPVIFTGTVRDGALESTQWQRDGSAFGPVPLAAGAFSAIWSLGTRDYHETDVVFLARDRAGNETRRAFHYVVDRAPPSISCDFANGAVLSLDVPALHEINGQVTDAALDRFTVRIDSGADQVVTPSPSSSAFKFPHVLALEDWTDHTVTLVARDRAGNETTLTRHYSVDRIAPQLALTSPNGQIFSASSTGSLLTLSGSTSDARLAGVEYTLDGGASIALTPSPSAGGLFSTPLALSSTEDYTDHAVRVVARDAAGNQAIATAHYVVDRSPPTLTVTSLLEGTIIDAQDPMPLAVQGSVAEAMLRSLTVAHDGGPALVLTPSASDGSFSFNVGGAVEDGGAHRFELVAVDNANNETHLTRHYSVDRVAPRMTMTAPASNASCGGSVCTGAVVSLASGSSFDFSGTITDGGGVQASVLVVIGSSTFIGNASAGRWSFSWTALPNDNGQLYSVYVIGIDTAGNQTELRRDVWVDRVAPTVLSSVDGQRLVDRQATLVAFSEPMDVASVVGAARVNGAAVASSFSSSSDGATFGFSNPAGLTAYTVTDLVIGRGAKDRAGNPIPSAATVHFLTEPVLPTALTAVAASAQNPAVAVDSDGLPLVLAWSASAGFKSFRWDGRSTFVTGTLSAGSGSSGGRIDDLQIVSTPPSGGALLPSLQARALLAAQTLSGGQQLYVAESTDLQTWRGHVSTTSPDLVGSMASWSRASFLPALRQECVIWLPSGACAGMNVVNQEGVRYAGTNGHVYEQPFTATGLGSATDVFAPASTPNILRGTALIGFQALYAPSGTNVASVTYLGATGAGRAALVGAMTGIVVPVGSAYMAWGDTGTFGLAVLKVACSPTPDQAGSWRSGSLGPSLLSSSIRYQGVAVELTPTEVGIALEADDGEAWFGTVPNDGCTTAIPMPQWTQFATNAKQVAIAPTPSGWVKVYVSTATGALYLLP